MNQSEKDKEIINLKRLLNLSKAREIRAGNLLQKKTSSPVTIIEKPVQVMEVEESKVEEKKVEIEEVEKTKNVFHRGYDLFIYVVGFLFTIFFSTIANSIVTSL